MLVCRAEKRNRTNVKDNLHAFAISVSSTTTLKSPIRALYGTSKEKSYTNL
jgi:hypothetical protein